MCRNKMLKLKGLIENYTLVSEMNAAFGNHSQDIEKAVSYIKSISDELNELALAIKTDSHPQLPEVRDALCDIQVFAYGALYLLRDVKNPYTIVDDFVSACITHIQYTGELSDDNLYMHYVITGISLAVKSLLDPPEDKDVYLIRVHGLSSIIAMCREVQYKLGVDVVEDMSSVITGVMSRFIKDAEDEEKTVSLHYAKGVMDVVFAGNYPYKVMYSNSDQPDAPKGKFLKSSSYSSPVFKTVDINKFF